jgi:hypothetical protein
MRSLDLPVKLIISPLRHSNTANYMFRTGVNRGQLQIKAELKANESAICLIIRPRSGST